MSEAPRLSEPDPVRAAFDRVLGVVRERDPGAEVAIVERAFEVACRAHAGQLRRSGEPYLIHPIRVSETIARLGLDTCSVAAGLLHDSVEDSELTVFDLTEMFNRELAGIVDGVTKLGKVPYLSRQEQQAESFRKMLLAMSQDIRVLLVKLADRLDNMRTLEHMPADKQARISRETMEIYAPLANRLGIQWIRAELQNLSFRYLEPAHYDRIRLKMDQLLAGAQPTIDAGVRQIEAAFAAPEGPGDRGSDAIRWPLERLGAVEVRTQIRVPFQVYLMENEDGQGVDSLADLVTYQVITPDRASCYHALGVVHGAFKPIPDKVRDYIALPRPNRYQALHTIVLSQGGSRMEVQIRSAAMDAVAERGIVAEWQRGISDGPDGHGGWRTMEWLGELMDWQGDVADPHEFIESVKADLFADEVYVYTPRGDLFTFSRGATPIDFAFAIHTDVGNHASGARVNGHLVPLRYQLRPGDTVEIITSPAAAPRREWLKMCSSPRARAKIKQHLRTEERRRLREVGRTLLEQELTGRARSLADLEASGAIEFLAPELDLGKDMRGEDGVYEAIGAGLVPVARVALRLAPPAGEGDDDDNLFKRVLRRFPGRRPAGPRGAAPQWPGLSPKEGAAGTPILVTRDRCESHGAGAPMIQLAPCCSPAPGDPLVAYFVPGKGIVAHVEGCSEALEHIDERRVYLAWEEGLELDVPVTLEVRTANTVGLLAEMSRAFSYHGVNIKQANCRVVEGALRAVNTFHATVRTLSQLESLIATLREIDGVLGVERVFARAGGFNSR